MTKLEKFYIYKGKLMLMLGDLKQAHDALKKLFDEEEDFDCNDFICDDYPFDKSFDEINIADWIYTVEEKLNKYEEVLENEQKRKD